MRIPKAFAAGAHLTPNAVVDLSLVDGKLVVAPISEPAAPLEELLTVLADFSRASRGNYR